MICLSILMTVFVGPETRYSRLHPARNKKPEITKPQRSNVDQNPPSSSSSNEDPTSVKETWVGRGRPSRSQFGLFQSNQEAAKSLLVNFWTPWNLFKFPIVQFASFVVSWSTSCFLTINLTQAQAFGSPPYNFSQTSIGLCNFSVLVGALIGLATAGPLSDWTAMRATIRNGGIREPEMRLPAMIPYVLIMILGNVVIAVGYQNQWPWAAIVIIGYACIGIQVTSLPAIASTYAVDSYKPVAGALFVSITVNKNVGANASQATDLTKLTSTIVVGLWIEQVSYSMDHLFRIFETNHAEHVLDNFVVTVEHYFLLSGENPQEKE